MELAGRYDKYTPEFRDEVAKLVVETQRSIADVARGYSLNETTLGNWVKKYRAAHAEDEPPLELSGWARLRELERRNRELEMENAFLKSSHDGRGPSSGMMRIRVWSSRGRGMLVVDAVRT